MSVLDTIVEKKRERLKEGKSKVSLRELKTAIGEEEKPRDFKKAITSAGTPARGSQSTGKIRLIAEIKRASPSRGLIRTDFDPVRIAEIYDTRADALSVLTEEDFFQGSLEYIKKVKSVTKKPVLRKDFIFDEYQIYEARAAGADAILLIETLLDSSQAEEYLHMAGEAGMCVLFEVHDLRGLEKALRVKADVIGINNRDLKTLNIDLNTTFTLKKELPPDRIVVSESGISKRDDVIRLREAGIDAMLIGTAFMEAPDIARKIEELLPQGSSQQR